MNRNDLRKGMCENDTERTVARWLMESDGDWDNVSKSSGIPVDDLKTWFVIFPTALGYESFCSKL